MSDSLWSKSASELAQLIRSREVSSLDVIDSHIERINDVNGEINAVVEILADSARQCARQADVDLTSGAALGAFHGVPISVKTNIDVKGSATTEGVLALRDQIATSDAPLVAKMRAAGAIVLSRTNMPDFGLRINSESELFGATHNPWDLSRTAGGSSGGEGAAIASGMSPLGFGNDIGGSLRNPAFACGIASIKPSFARVAAANDTDTASPLLHAQLMLTHGPMARTVNDVRSALRVVMGSDPRDPYALDAPLEGPLRAKRAALVPEPAGGSTDANIADGVRAAGRALEAQGYEVEEISPPMLEESYFAWIELMYWGLENYLPSIDTMMGEGGRRFLELTSVDMGQRSDASLSSMQQRRHTIAVAFQKFFDRYPVIVGPTWTQPPFALGWDIDSVENAFAVTAMFRFVLPANLLGLPAACVPTGVANGLPTGVQVIASRFREDLCLDAAEAIEHELGVLTPIDPRH
jgi:amidase